MQRDSDTALDNAKHEVEFCITQLGELTPEITEIARRELTSDNVIEQYFIKLDGLNWNERYKNTISKLAVTQAKYIRLLEARLGK